MKKMISLILLIGLCAGSLGTASAVNDNKVSDWAQSYVEKAISLNWIDDTVSDGDFTKNITREAFCNLVFNSLKTYSIDTVTTTAENPFSDTSSYAVAALYDAGIINGKSDTAFAPDDFLTREEAAAILYRICEKLGIKEVFANYMLSNHRFVDEADFSEWATSDIYNISLLGIMNGVGNDVFAPKDNYTIEQSITTMLRLYEKYIYKLKFVDSDNNIILDSTDVISCEVVFSQIAENTEIEEYYLELFISDEAKKKFAEATYKIVQTAVEGKNFISIYINNVLISQPLVFEKIESNTFVISGNFTKEQAEDFAETINTVIK